jgi:two-component sensor histidine kinase
LQPEVHVSFDRQGDELAEQVRDNGTGLPGDFSIDKTTSLGLSIVRGLVKSQLGGKIRMYNSGGTVVELVVPVSRAESSDLARI